MSTNDSTSSLEEVKSTLEAEVPDDLTISQVTYEGPQLIIYPETPRKFAERDGLIPRLASTIRNRITVRPAPGARTSPTEAKPRILDLIPEEARITNLEFYPATGEVLIEAENQGLSSDARRVPFARSRKKSVGHRTSFVHHR